MDLLEVLAGCQSVTDELNEMTVGLNDIADQNLLQLVDLTQLDNVSQVLEDLYGALDEALLATESVLNESELVREDLGEADE